MPKDISENKFEQKNGYYEINIFEDQLDDLFLLLRLDKSLLPTLFDTAYRKHFKKHPESKQLPHSHIHFKNFIFRGQRSSSWDLVPNLFREHKDQWVRKEIEALTHFLSVADICNIQVPSDSFLFRQKLKNILNEIHSLYRNNWINSSFYELIGYAQHYALPTRFLDWSYHPMVALYFGSSGYLKFVKAGNKTDENNEYFSLWILNTDYLPHDEIGLIDLPKAINQRIALQKGCFTNVRQFPAENSQKNRIIYQYLKPESPFSEDYILLQEVLSQHHLDYTLLKINIPTSLAYSTFKYCDHMGFNAATLLKDIKDYMNEYSILKNHESI